MLMQLYQFPLNALPHSQPHTHTHIYYTQILVQSYSAFKSDNFLRFDIIFLQHSYDEVYEIKSKRKRVHLPLLTEEINESDVS